MMDMVEVHGLVAVRAIFSTQGLQRLLRLLSPAIPPPMSPMQDAAAAADDDEDEDEDDEDFSTLQTFEINEKHGEGFEASQESSQESSQEAWDSLRSFLESFLGFESSRWSTLRIVVEDRGVLDEIFELLKR